MPPEDIPEDARQSFPCPICGGEVTPCNGVWTCSDCSFAKEDMPMPEDNRGAIPLAADVQCVNCALDLRPENALMIEGKPFCDEFCAEQYKKKPPLAAGLHRDGSIHIYTDGEDSGLRIGRDKDKKGGLIVYVDESTRLAALAAKGGDD